MLTKRQRIVLSYPPLAELIKEDQKLRQQCIKNVNEIASTFEKKVIRTVEKTLDVTLLNLYEGINLEINPPYSYPDLIKENNVILVPNHQSHADYIALNYILFKEFKIVPFIAGGINLNIFPIGKLFRKCGCFFIRRTFHDDQLYKLTLEGYLYYLLQEGIPIEFFFEGGRSRSGKLLPPRYGLFHMLSTAHSYISKKNRRPLVFVPVSIMHEYVPEQKTLARELAGEKKKKESVGQLLKIFQLFKYRMGTIHLRLGAPIEFSLRHKKNPREDIQQLAITCFREVASQLMVTPTGLLAMILLDTPEGALQFAEIYHQAQRIVSYCLEYKVPLAQGLEEFESLEGKLRTALNMLIKNSRVEKIGAPHNSHQFYAIKENCRSELLYFKNSILHHFIVPYLIHAAWRGLFSGEIKSEKDLAKLIMHLRDQLKFEFYLPTTQKTLIRSLRVISRSTNKEVKNLKECMELSHPELMLLAQEVNVFSRSLTYLTENYFIGALTVRRISKEGLQKFGREFFIKKTKETFEIEKSIARVVRHEEGHSLPVIKNSLKYLENLKIVHLENNQYTIQHIEALDKLITRMEKELIRQVRYQFRM